MASIKNLSRIHEIAESLPKLEDARKLLADSDSSVLVAKPKKQTPSGEQQGVCIILPKEVKMNVLNVINIEINKQKEELKDL